MIRYRRASPGVNVVAPPGARPGPFGRLTRGHILGQMGATNFKKGERYWLDDRVVSVKLENEGALIEGQVSGSARRPYFQTIRLTETGASVNISGSCSCPLRGHCKHVVAALLAALGEPGGQADGGPAQAPAQLDLDPALAAWVDRLARLDRTEANDYPPDLRQRLIYVLRLHAPAESLAVLVATPTSARLLKDDSFSTDARPYAINGSARNHPLYFRPNDRVILEELARLSDPMYVHPGRALTGEAGVAILERMLATGRARWQALDGPVLSAGPPRQGSVAWALSKDGAYRPVVQLDPPTAQALRMAPPHYVDIAAAVIGPIDTGLAPRVADAALSAPPVPPRQAPLLRAALARRAPGFAALEPPSETQIERMSAAPVPRLRLFSAPLPVLGNFGWSSGYGRPAVEETALARLSFRYGEFVVDAGDSRSLLSFAQDGKIVEIERNRRAEQRAWGHLGGTGLAKLRGWNVPEQHRGDLRPHDEPHRTGWIDLLHRHLPRLRDDGWNIEIAADFPIRVVEATGPVDAVLREGSGIDWFELELGVTLDGERVDLVPILLPLLAGDDLASIADGVPARDAEPIHLPLPDGRVLVMTAGRLRPIVAALRELFAAGLIDAKSPKVGFSPFDAPSLAELEAAAIAAGAAWRGGERLRELGRLLNATGSIPQAAIPSSFTGALRTYQARGVDWLQFLRRAGLGGVLADEMGLGKTVQTLAHLAIEQAEGRLERPALLVCPTSLVPNWRREADRFAPGLRLLVLHGATRKTRFADIAGHDLVITTYPLLPRDHAVLAEQDWRILVLDEAQTIKNPAATTTRLLRTFRSQHRLCLTGTPLENHLGELWSLFAFLTPGFLGDRTAFNRQWRTPIEKRGDASRRRLLARRVRPFMLRRTKAEVVAELPPKTDILESVEMEPGQRDVYESIRLAMHERVRDAIAQRGLARSRIVVLDALLKLRQACCDPRLLKLKAAAARKAGSAKLGRLMAMLPELLEDGRRILLFSQFTSMLALIEEALRGAEMKYLLLTGDTRDRDTPIRRFQAGEVPLFLISLKAGGLGLNLTAADTVIHYDPWWNPAVEDQATDRAHRIGQEKPVFVHKLVMLASIEEKMEALKLRKRDLAAGLFDPDAGSTLDLTEADVEDLFASA